MTNKQYIKEKIDEIFEPIEDDKCDDCQTNFSVTKIEIKDFLTTALEEERQRIDKEISEQFKYASEHNNYDMRGVDWSAIVNPPLLTKEGE